MRPFFEACLILAPQELYSLCPLHGRGCGEEIVARMIRWLHGRLMVRQGGSAGSGASTLSTLLIRWWRWAVHSRGPAGGGAGKNIFSVVLLDANTLAAITVPMMLPSVNFGGIPTTMILLSPTIPPKIHPRYPTVINFKLITPTRFTSLSFDRYLQGNLGVPWQ